MARIIRALVTFAIAIGLIVSIAPLVAAAPDDLIQRGQASLMGDPKDALAAANAASAALKSQPDSRQTTIDAARVDWLTGAALIGLDRAPEALTVIEHGLSGGIARLAPQSKIYGDLTFAHATALSFLGRFEPALSELLRAYEIYGGAGEKRGQALALQNIGTIYAQARDYDHAVQYFEQSANTFRSDPALLLSIANNEAAALKEQGAYAKAIARYRYALDLARTMHSPILQVRILSGLAAAQLGAGQIGDADDTIDEGLKLSRDSASPAWRAALYRVAAEAALRRGALDRATELIGIALQSGSANSAPDVRDAQRTAYAIYKARHDGRNALIHLEAYKELDDQTRTVAASANAALMAARFDFANQRASIAQLRTTEIQSEARIARGQRTILTILLVGSGIISALLLVGFLATRRSRNEVRAANEELSETNSELERALAARTEFLATTSHEIRTPLNGILGMTQVILADRGLESSLKSKIELVHGAGETMRALVDDILDVAKITNGELTLHPGEMDLARLLRDTAQVWEGQAQAKGIAIALQLDDCPDRIVQDEVRLRQIVFNLMANAVKFTDRGEVRLVAAAVGGADGGERLNIEVRDTGIGIPPDKLDDIFESFRQVDSGTTRKHGGTGLGLAICRSLARAMGGEVLVDSVLGAGATFSLDLPLVRGAVRAAPVSASADGSLGTARLLLVEANPLSQSILRAVLGAKVACVIVAANVEESAPPIARGEADLLLIDGGTLGADLEAAAALARPILESGGRAVLLWPSPDAGLRERAMAFGLTALLATPIAAPDLVAALAALYEPVSAPEEIAA